MKLILLVLLMTFTSAVFADATYCPTVKITGKKIDFSDTELNLICGDKKSHAWKYIPPYEAQFILKGFLQSRGYLNPHFEVKEGVLHVKKGHKSTVKKVHVIAGNHNLEKKIQRDLKRLYKRRELTTSMLNSMEGDANGQLRKRGFPCGKVNSEVDVNTDTVTMLIRPDEKYKFGKIKREEIPGLHENALDRFYPMKDDQRFNGDLLILTEKRILRAEVLQGTYFLEKCGKNNFSLEQRFIVGPARTFRFGAGASTEVGPMARARWSHNRAGKMASLLSASLEASLRVQSLNLTADYFPWTDKPRQSLFSQIDVIRESQFKYEQFLTRVRPQMKWTRDIHQHGTTLILGPAYENGTYHSQDKSDTRTFSTAVLEGSFQRMSHDYEIFDIHPQEGDEESIALSYRNPMLGFGESLTKIDTSAVRLGRLTNLGRGAIIGGIRMKAGTSFVRSTADLSALPPEVKYFGGGSDDLRGYLLRTLPRNDGAGALSKFLLKGEIRKTHFFHEKVETFTFVDGGYFGEKSFSLESRIWYSPGLGLRWLSPIGLVQGYWARALATSPSKDFGNFFFAGIGGTF
ncbi:MAG: BamA/TamA family outer membrane protein [Bdellovibrionota bacterium]